MGFLDNMKQMMEIKQKMDEVKKRLDTITVVEENEYVRITVTGNRKVKDITILKNNDVVMLEGKLQSTMNAALEKADNVMQAEMMGATKGMMPNGLPGM